MRKSLLLIVPLLFFAGCTKELPIELDPEKYLIEETSEVVPDAIVIHAGFETPETKSRLEMNEEGSYAKVLWTKDDAFRLIGVRSSEGYYNFTFSTEQDGVTDADFTCSEMVAYDDVVQYYAYYPDASFQGYSNGCLGVYIPSQQDAVAGGIAEGLNISFSTVSDLGDDLSFKNIPALLKFRLSGNSVKDITSVKFIATSTIAGEGVIQDLDSGQPTYNFNSWVGKTLDEYPGSVVTLNGKFEEDVDYYMALFPGTTEGFSMLFLNDKGEYIIKESSINLTLNRSRITDFGTISVGNTFGDPLVTQYMKQTKGQKPVDVVVLPDGFTSAQKDDFVALASSGIDYLFETEPYKSYKEYFNVYFIWASSKESGASITDGEGNIQTARNTAFGSRWGKDSYNDMAADENKIYSYVSAHCPEIVLEHLSVEEVPVLLIINDERYGGRAHTYASGRTYCMVPYIRNGEPIPWAYPSVIPSNDDGSAFEAHNRTEEELAEVGMNTGDWRNTLLHEFGGHSFGRLKDEYWGLGYFSEQSDIDTHSWPVPFGLNISGRYDTVTWQVLLDKKDELVSKNQLYDRIGKYQGGDTYIFNRWRSEKISCMIDNRQYFSAWQRILIAKRITELADMTFDMDEYLLIDDPTDPIRDDATKIRTVNISGPVQIMPPFAEPELIDNSPSNTRVL